MHKCYFCKRDIVDESYDEVGTENGMQIQVCLNDKCQRSFAVIKNGRERKNNE